MAAIRPTNFADYSEYNAIRMVAAFFSYTWVLQVLGVYKTQLQLPSEA